MTIEHLHFSTQMLRRLGEELNPHPDQGILELVRNAYDADATQCTVELIAVEDAGGTVRVSDNGEGMTAEEVRNGWLMLGKSVKTTDQRTKRKRSPIGNKGIGRLAALRLGQIASLTTRPVEQPLEEYRLTLDWEAFDNASVVEEVPLKLSRWRRPKGAPRGTVIEISNLHQRLTEQDVKRLARALVLLSDPFGDRTRKPGTGDFRAVLQAKEFQALEELVARGYLDEADYYLRAQLDTRGLATAFVFDSAGEELFRGEHQDISAGKGSPAYKAPAAVFELWWFVLKAANFSPRAVTLTEVKEWLGEFGGVHLYHRGMRVSPYSDFDWLDMNLRRVRSPEQRPSTNNSIGRLAVADEEGELQPKTDRVGFVENEAFQDVKRFATDTLGWFADQMLKRWEQDREQQKKRVSNEVRRTHNKLQAAIDEVPAESKARVQEAIAAYERAKGKETNALQVDLQLYRTLGTAGAVSAAFAHQVKSPLVHIASSAATLEDCIADGGLFRNQTVTKLAAGIKKNAESLLAFAKVTLGLLQHEKRRRERVSVHASVRDIVTLLEPYLTLRETEVQQELMAEVDSVLASRAAMESILTNLLINSLKAFERRGPSERLIVIRTRNVAHGEEEKEFLELTVLDNGPGIKGISIKDIWLPGKTTTEEGTGLGLTIVKDVACELGGSVAAVASGEFGGAEIFVNLPVRRGR